MAYILIVEDEKTINDLIYKNLHLVGHTCDQAVDGLQALHKAQAETYDLLLIDVMLPGLSGFELLSRLPKTPAIFLTARGSLRDRVNGLNLGADDYIVKPFETLELIARVNAVLRRTKKAENIMAIGDILVDCGSRTVMRNGLQVEITPQEFSLLETLLINRNIALSREKLLELAWGYDYAGETRTVDSHIQKLRMKLGLDDVIKTVYKLGYRLEWPQNEGRK